MWKIFDKDAPAAEDDNDNDGQWTNCDQKSSHETSVR